MIEAKKRSKGYLTMRLNNMNDYLDRVESIVNDLKQQEFKKGTFEDEEVSVLMDKANDKIKNLKNMGFTIVKS